MTTDARTRYTVHAPPADWFEPVSAELLKPVGVRVMGATVMRRAYLKALAEAVPGVSVLDMAGDRDGRPILSIAIDTVGGPPDLALLVIEQAIQQAMG